MKKNNPLSDCAASLFVLRAARKEAGDAGGLATPVPRHVWHGQAQAHGAAGAHGAMDN
ncbi:MULTISPECIES: hypothetical protein [unclassified Acidovorax]|uniref:hypothetical protein n=1 Tax=unclassified Acidovorax TaxID=2684926 RepID=UPI000ABFE71C|nr:MULTISPECIES: hypothetical protein [unclassified Acidovorax]